MKVQTADEARQQRTDEARAIIRWLAANPMEWAKALVNDNSDLVRAMQDQRVAVNAAKIAWDEYAKFDPSTLSRRIKFLGQIGTVGSENDARRGRGFVGQTVEDRPRLRFNFESGAASQASALLRKQLDASLRAIKDNLDAQKTAYDFAQQTVEGYYTDGQNALAANIEAQRAIRAAGLTSLVASLDAEIAALQSYRAKAAKPEERLDADAKIADAQAKRTAAIVAGQRAESIATAQAARDVRELERAYEDLFVNVLQLRGDEAGAAAMAKAGTVAVLLPGAFYFIRETQKPPVELFRKHGVPMALAQLMIEAGLPAGILNVVNGDKEAVDAILDDPDVKAIGFVGSTPIAQYIYERAAQTGKRCQCFGGAKNHAIIMPDADMDQAVDALIGAGYGSAGERCMAVSVAVPVGKTTADRLMEKLIPRVESLKIGTSVDPSADYGPLVTREAVEKVKSYIDIGVKEGATLAVDGRGFKMQGYENGFYLGGSLFDNVTKDMRIYKEEIFGPVLSVVRAKDYHEALALPSDHDYGNGVAIFTRDGDAARDFAAKVNVGMVGVNVPIPVPIAYYTFGGWKKSGFGDLNQHGPDSVRFYTKTKTVTSRWTSGVKDGAEFSIPTMK